MRPAIYPHDPEVCGCENDAPWCPYNPSATEIEPYWWVKLGCCGNMGGMACEECPAQFTPNDSRTQ